MRPAIKGLAITCHASDRRAPELRVGIKAGVAAHIELVQAPAEIVTALGG